MSSTLERSPRPLAAAPFIDAAKDNTLAERAAPVATKRLLSLDVFRGITIAAMILVNNIDDEHAYRWMTHAEWHGWTPTDLVFPFFLFIVGVATPFSLAKRGQASGGRGALLGGIWARALALFMLGQLSAASNLVWPLADAPTGFIGTNIMRVLGFVLVYGGIFALLIPWPSKRFRNWLPLFTAVAVYGYLFAMHFVRAKAIAAGWPEKPFGGGAFNPDMLRIPGVLQRIGICYGIAATVALFSGWKTVLSTAVLVCVGYCLLMFNTPFPGHKIGSLEQEDNFARAIDVAVLEKHETQADGTTKVVRKHTYSAYPDNEGIVSTLPAIATALLGILAGYFLRSPKSPDEHAAGLLAVGLPVLLLGLCLNEHLIPINKNLWTPSFTVFTAGMALLTLGFVYWLIEVQNRRLWAWPFKVMGMNAIAAFMASTLIFRFTRLFLITGDNGEKYSWLSVVDRHLKDWLHNSAGWISAQSASLPNIDTAANQTLLHAAFILLCIFALMWVLYVCRIFVKV